MQAKIVRPPSRLRVLKMQCNLQHSADMDDATMCASLIDCVLTGLSHGHSDGGDLHTATSLYDIPRSATVNYERRRLLLKFSTSARMSVLEVCVCIHVCVLWPTRKRVSFLQYMAETFPPFPDFGWKHCFQAEYVKGNIRKHWETLGNIPPFRNYHFQQ